MLRLRQVLPEQRHRRASAFQGRSIEPEHAGKLRPAHPSKTVEDAQRRNDIVLPATARRASYIETISFTFPPYDMSTCPSLYTHKTGRIKDDHIRALVVRRRRASSIFSSMKRLAWAANGSFSVQVSRQIAQASDRPSSTTAVEKLSKTISRL